MNFVYYLYILKCADKTLYTGIAKDLIRRVKEHNTSKLGAKYTRGRRPVKLVYSKKFKNRSLASRAEARIKLLSRTEKLNVIASKAKQSHSLVAPTTGLPRRYGSSQ